jgi:hypothetical protein
MTLHEMNERRRRKRRSNWAMKGSSLETPDEEPIDFAAGSLARQWRKAAARFLDTKRITGKAARRG